jgi:hypothetical protein
MRLSIGVNENAQKVTVSGLLDKAVDVGNFLITGMKLVKIQTTLPTFGDAGCLSQLETVGHYFEV